MDGVIHLILDFVERDGVEAKPPDYQVKRSTQCWSSLEERLMHVSKHRTYLKGRGL